MNIKSNKVFHEKKIKSQKYRSDRYNVNMISWADRCGKCVKKCISKEMGSVVCKAGRKVKRQTCIGAGGGGIYGWKIVVSGLLTRTVS